MTVLRPPGVIGFLDLADPLLAHDEARHNLIYGICSIAIDDPDAYPEILLWVVVREGRPVLAAIRTPPFPLVLSDAIEEDAIEELFDAVAQDRAEVPGLSGNAPLVDLAARSWSARTGTRAEVVLSQGVHALTVVEDVARAPGGARPARTADRGLLQHWMRAFAEEALPHERREPDAEHEERALDARIRNGPGVGLWVWEHGGAPVAMAGYLGKTPTGIRVGPVYTPREHRRRGYATALVAELTRGLLDQGNRACFLFTDLANPTSNAIYARIGYRRICDAVEYRSVPAVTGPPTT
jgi:predicted GNAT family acetyltransferase